MHIFLTILFTLLIACSNEKSGQNDQSSEAISKLVSNAECGSTLKIRDLLSNVRDAKKLELSTVFSVINLFKENEDSSGYCFGFPHKEVDTALFYWFKDSLISASIGDYRFIPLYVGLTNIISKNAEWSEMLTDEFHKIALENTGGLIMVFKDLDNKNNDLMTLSIGYLGEFDYLEIFIEKLNGISDSSLQETISATKIQITRVK